MRVEVREGAWCAWRGVTQHELLEERGFWFGGYKPDGDACVCYSPRAKTHHERVTMICPSIRTIRAVCAI